MLPKLGSKSFKNLFKTLVSLERLRRLKLPKVFIVSFRHHSLFPFNHLVLSFWQYVLPSYQLVLSFWQYVLPSYQLVLSFWHHAQLIPSFFTVLWILLKYVLSYYYLVLQFWHSVDHFSLSFF